jgi:hypothetical protein
MIKETEKIVMYDSPEAATYKTNIEGWVNREGQFWGKDEHMARWSGCTHMVCECGNIYGKGRVRCDSCQAKVDTDKFLALPMEDWDGVDPVCLWSDDKFFFDECSLIDYMGDRVFDAKEMGEDTPVIEIVKCESRGLSEVSEDYWCDELPEDGEVPDDIAEALDNLNKVIKESTYKVWWAGKVRINMDPLWQRLKEEDDEEKRTNHAQNSDQEEASGN